MDFKKCTVNDLDLLCCLSAATYSSAFADQNTPSNMGAYLRTAFAADKIKNELLNPASDFYFLFCSETLAGYFKLNDCPAQTDIHDPVSLEIERIYVLREFQGKGLGRAMIEKAIGIARDRKKDYLWLGVWEKNQKALSFYKDRGFYKIGAHAFVMGKDKQTDFIMCRDL